MIPQDRTEEYYAAILGTITGEGEAVAPSPVWRKEEFLAAILAAAKGEEPSIPDPVWRDEAWLALIAQALSEGGSGGGVSKPRKDVNFYDNEGNVVYAYTAAEFAGLDAMPSNPNRKGLTAQGWNLSLADAKTYVANYGKLWIGQMYITESGDTEIDVELHAPRLSPYLSLAVNGTVEVDWGDGTTKSTVTGTSLTTLVTTPHVYTTDGLYTIKIHAVSGSFSLLGNSKNSILGGNFSSGNNNIVYASSVRRVRVGSVSSIGDYAFNNCRSLVSVTIPSSVTSIGTYAFTGCGSLASITIPSGVTSIGNDAFSYCYSLTSVTIPSGVTSIGIHLFHSCNSLASITIPSDVTSIGNGAFAGCQVVTSVTIPSGVTSISNDLFSGCHALTSITIPSSVTLIGVSSFSSCYGLGLIRFERTTPSEVSNANAWANLPTDCILYVTFSALAAYLSAGKYPNPATYTYMGFATYNSGETLPTQDSTEAYNVTWYATKADAIAQTNPITEGTGSEIYCRYAAV